MTPYLEVFLSLLFAGTVLCRRHGDMKDSDHVDSEAGDDPWLVDFTQDYAYEMQADSAGPSMHGGRTYACPPAPRRFVTSLCHASKCGTDADCGEEEKCCFNGCVRRCVKVLTPPPVVDWIREPPRRLKSGLSWLVSGPFSQSQAESCSTNDVLEADEDPLLCPHGFVCHIEDLGNPARGIPNRGRCIREHGSTQDTSNVFRIREYSRTERKICVFENTVLLDGTHFLYGRHPCECRKGSITCRVGQR